MRKIALLLVGLLVAGLLALSSTTANAAVCGTGRWISSSPSTQSVYYDDDVARDRFNVQTRARVQYCNGGMKIVTHVSSRVTPVNNRLNCSFFGGFYSNPSYIGNTNPSTKSMGCWKDMEPRTLTWDIPNQTVWGSKSINQSIKVDIKGGYDTVWKPVARVYF